MILHTYYWIKSLFKKNWHLRFDGEFSYELIAVLPFAHWLHKKGKHVTITSAKDTKCLYYFANNHIEEFSKRHSGFVSQRSCLDFKSRLLVKHHVICVTP